MRTPFLSFITLYFLFFNLQMDAKNASYKHSPFVVHSIPKCGTHFIQRTMTLLTKQKFRHSGENNFENHLEDAEKRNLLLRLFGPHTQIGNQILTKKRYKLVAMIRDPRDALISLLFYMRRGWGDTSRRDFFIVDHDFDSLSLDEQIMSLIEPRKNGLSYLNYYNSRIGWALSPKSLIVKYEDLVGEEGGGDLNSQIKTIFSIIDYTNLQISHDEVQDILPQLYAREIKPIRVGNKIFQPGYIGNWKTFLNEEHKTLLKKYWGDLLIQLGYEEDYNW